MVNTLNRHLIFSLLIILCHKGLSQDSTSINVRFLYGSKPKKEFKNEEFKWFGGKLGGHVGIETAPDSVLNILPHNGLHIFARKSDFHSKFYYHTVDQIWSIFGGNPLTAKTVSITIPISISQKDLLDSISNAYINSPPYDYAFIGMRCGASTYEILAQLEILKPYGHRKTYWKIFYPRRLRKRVIKLALKNNWEIKRTKGTTKRKWEKD